MRPRAEPTKDRSNTPKSVVGRVVSNKMQKTVVVAVEWTIVHPQYKKVVRRSTRYMAHDDRNCGVGDLVRLSETRPLSKRKRWRVVSILERAVEIGKAAQEPTAS
ncbi:MAG: 30S ribosomal protein S17 [Nitrospirota bacterium]